MAITPIGERVILTPKQGEEKTKTGIYLPKAEDKKEGIITAVGTRKDGGPLPLTVGDHVVYSGYSNEEIELEGKKYVVVDFKDVIAKIGGNE